MEIILVIAIYLIPPLLFAWGGQHMAKNRGRHEVGWAIACFFTGILGIIILAIVGESAEYKNAERARLAQDVARLTSQR